MANSMSGSKGMSGGEKIPSGYSQGKLQQFTPEQMEMLKQMAERLGPDSWLYKLANGDESQFAEMEAPALKQFSAEQGNIASRFSGMGTGGSKSSGFKNSINQAASDFSSDLQSKRMELRNQAMKDLMGYSSDFLSQKPYENFLTKKDNSSSGWGGVAGAAVGGAGGFLAGGPAGGLAGANLGYKVGSGF